MKTSNPLETNWENSVMLLRYFPGGVAVFRTVQLPSKNSDPIATLTHVLSKLVPERDIKYQTVQEEEAI